MSNFNSCVKINNTLVFISPSESSEQKFQENSQSNFYFKTVNQLIKEGILIKTKKKKL